MYMNAKNYARVFVPMFGDPFFTMKLLSSKEAAK